MLDLEKAKQYELEHHIFWATKNLKLWCDLIESDKNNNNKWNEQDHWIKRYCSNVNLDYFKEKENNKWLEIGVGSYGSLFTWWWLNDRTVIEPLYKEYYDLQFNKYGETLVDSKVKHYNTNAEILIDELVNTIDGFVICHNTLDHLNEPKKVISNIGQYMKKDSYLFLQSDLYHCKDDPGDAHLNIFKSKKEIIDILKSNLLDPIIQFDYPERPSLNYGCLARKID
jgi:hypothetical protein